METFKYALTEQDNKNNELEKEKIMQNIKLWKSCIL